MRPENPRSSEAPINADATGSWITALRGKVLGGDQV